MTNNNISFVSGEVSGSGIYECTGGDLHIDPGATLNGSDGTWILNGVTADFIFEGSTGESFADELQFFVGEASISSDFSHRGKFQLGGNVDYDLQLGVGNGVVFELGLDCD